MAKMTKAQARKRLTEASKKIGKVWLEWVGSYHGANLTPAQQTKTNKELIDARDNLLKIADKLK